MIRIRKATLEDAETASRIVRRCYEGFAETDVFHDRVIVELKKYRGTVEHIAEFITIEDFFIADDERLVKGLVGIKGSEISKLYVHPHHQKQGIGRQLFSHAEAFILARGYDSMFVGTVTRAAIPFYERMGMKTSQRLKIDCGPCIGMTSTILTKMFDA